MDVLSLVLHFRIFVVIVAAENPDSTDCMLKTYLVLLVEESKNNIRSHQDILLVLKHSLVVGNYHISSLKYLFNAVVPESLLAVNCFSIIIS